MKMWIQSPRTLIFLKLGIATHSYNLNVGQAETGRCLGLSGRQLTLLDGFQACKRPCLNNREALQCNIAQWKGLGSVWGMIVKIVPPHEHACSPHHTYTQESKRATGSEVKGKLARQPASNIQIALWHFQQQDEPLPHSVLSLPQSPKESRI